MNARACATTGDRPSGPRGAWARRSENHARPPCCILRLPTGTGAGMLRASLLRLSNAPRGVAAPLQAGITVTKAATRSKSRRRPAHDVLFEPLKVGNKTFRNRFYVVPFSTGYAMDRIKTSAGFRGTQGEGGWAAVSVGMCSTRPDSVYQAGSHERLWGNEDEQRLREVVDAIHAHGALATIELGHRGALTGNLDTRWPAISPSGLPP